MLNMLSKVQDLIELVRNGIIYDETVCDMRSRLLKVNDALVALSCAQDTPQTAPRFCLRLPAHDVWLNDGIDGRYVKVEARELYCIDGFFTESKILAIKQVRTLDNNSLMEAKNLVDALQDNARTINQQLL